MGHLFPGAATSVRNEQRNPACHDLVQYVQQRFEHSRRDLEQGHGRCMAGKGFGKTISQNNIVISLAMEVLRRRCRHSMSADHRLLLHRLDWGMAGAEFFCELGFNGRDSMEGVQWKGCRKLTLIQRMTVRAHKTDLVDDTTHTHAHTHQTYNDTLPLTHTHTITLSLSHTHTHTHTLTYSHTHARTQPRL